MVTSPIEWHQFLSISATTVLIIILARVIGSILNVLQWKALQDRARAVSFLVSCRVILTTYYLAYAPFRGVQLAVRAMVAKNNGLPYVTTVPSLTVNLFAKWVPMIATIPLLAYAFLGSELIYALWLPLAAVAVLILGLALLLRYRSDVVRIISRWLSAKSLKRGDKLKKAEDISQLSTDNLAAILNWKSLLLYYILFFSASLIEYWALSLLWKDLGIPIFFIFLMVIYFTGGLVGWLSQVPGGFAVQELVSASIMSLMGADFALALAILTVSRVLILLVDLLISLVSSFTLRQKATKQLPNIV